MHGDQQSGCRKGLGAMAWLQLLCRVRPPGKGVQDEEGPAGKLQERLRSEQVVKYLQCAGEDSRECLVLRGDQTSQS